MANVELPAAVGDQGRTVSGVAITDDLIDRLAAKAEEGHDVEQMLRRRKGCPPTSAYEQYAGLSFEHRCAQDYTISQL